MKLMELTDGGGGSGVSKLGLESLELGCGLFRGTSLGSLSERSGGRSGISEIAEGILADCLWN